MKFRKKPVVVEATQWFKNGDHQAVVRFRHRPQSNYPGWKCEKCRHLMSDHGWVHTLEGGHIVCPGDWIITGVEDEMYPCKPSIFRKTYDLEIKT